MTTEEKARAYDEAVNKIKPLYEQAKRDGNPIWSTYEYLIPELRESEDEKIRTRFIEYFQGFLEGYEDCYKYGGSVRWEGLDVKSIIAWLEKQKEQKVDIDKLRRDIYQSGYNDGYQHGKEDVQKEQKPWKVGANAYFTPEQKPADEQFPPLEGLDAIKAKYYDEGFKNGFDEGVESVKPAEWDDYTKINLDRAIQIIKNAKGNLQGYQTDDGIYECDKAIEALEHFLYCGLEIEQPAEWSEHDLTMIDNVLGTYKTLEDTLNLSTGQDRDILESMNFERDWLKSLPKRVSLKSEQEWSEEDERILKGIIGKIDHEQSYGVSKVEMLSFLKSLRPDSYKNCNGHWKPSEEQMEALEETINQDCVVCNGDRKWIKPNLESLYEQLKKMKAPKGVPPIESIQK